MINTKNLKHKLMAVRFAIWELQLYLDTHFCDSEAMCLMNSYREQYKEVLKEYECKYGALTSMSDDDCTWTTTPFPWVNCGSDS